ncbi:MAG: DUF58 domain-containing protein [Caldimicrobium sp.]|nr:DUF58 domain-containing protein [Caldimicrobium sp.]MDW8094991.1 DUF58 domain-containing protein [Caldimicrobium sp.]
MNKLWLIFQLGSLKLTKTGLLYSLLTIFLGVSAVNTNNNILFVMVSLLLSFMWLSGIFSNLNLRGIHLEVLPLSEWYARRLGYLRVRLQRKRPIFPFFLLRISLRIRDTKGKPFEVGIKRAFLQGEEEIGIPVVFPSRGKYLLEEVEVTSIFPMGFVVRRVSFSIQREFVVFPEPKRCSYLRKREKRRTKEGESRGALRGYSEFEGIQEYLAGTPSKFISWKSLAKWDQLKRKVFTEEEKPPLIIDLRGVPGGDLEEKLSCACYLILEAFQRGEAIGLILRERLIPPATGPSHRYRLLKELALYGEN